MLGKITSWFDGSRREAQTADQQSMLAPADRRRAWWHFQLMDHAFLRVWWTNLDEIAPGVWRSNQPSPKRIARYADMGIRTIISLRGESEQSYNLLEREACAEHGIQLKHVALAARSLRHKRSYLDLLDLFDTVDKPFLLHCKSGADRAGLASVFYMIHAEGKSVEQARHQLSLRYLHLKNDNTGVLDHMLEAYEADNDTASISLRDWLKTRYDRDALTASFKERRGRKS